MTNLQILLVEDTSSAQESFSEAVSVFNRIHASDAIVKAEIVVSVAEALQKILFPVDGAVPYDGIVLDLKLEDNNEGGNVIAKKLSDVYARIPVVFVTATPGSVESNAVVYEAHSRDDKTYADDLDFFLSLKLARFTNVLGGCGIIEKHLSEVFQKSLLPQREVWAKYGQENHEKTERALLRYTLNHMMQLLDDDEDLAFAEEFYIHPPFGDELRAGLIVKKKDCGEFFVVMNPACDLVKRKNGDYKAEKIVLCAIDPIVSEHEDFGKQTKITKRKVEKVVKNCQGASSGCALQAAVLDCAKTEDGLKRLRNNRSLHHHFLPPTKFFPGGMLNFRNIETCFPSVVDAQYEQEKILIAPFFLKDIVSRFASYYARQGQPDLNHEALLKQVFPSA